jgi:1-acyl-sn-glycerol-3-phosphate acyltransferase
MVIFPRFPQYNGCVGDLKSMMAETGGYRTDPGARRSALYRCLRLLRLPFILYPGTLGVILRSSRMASRGLYGDDEWAWSSLDVLRELEKAGVDFDVSGLDNIRRVPGAAVFVANHMSTLETFILPGLIRPSKPVTFVVKESLMTFPIFGPVMRSRDPIPVGRANPRDDYAAVMEGGANRLGEGISMVIFPQTTRAAVFNPAEFNSLGIKLARRARAPVIPVAVKSDAWLNGRRLKDFGPLGRERKVYVRFGEPLAVEGTGAAQHALVVDFISRSLAEWK